MKNRTHAQHKALERQRMRRKLLKRLDANIGGSDWRRGYNRHLDHFTRQEVAARCFTGMAELRGLRAK